MTDRIPTEPSTDSAFDNKLIVADLKRRSVRGGAVTVSAQVIKFFLALGATPILARLLTPNDFGLVAMVTVLTSFLAMFRDMGLTAATIQRETIDARQLSALFWINLAFALFLMLLGCAAAPVIALFFKNPEVRSITIAMSGCFVFSGLAAQHQALMRRQMRFTALMSIQILAAVAGVLTAIISAWKFDAGYWALVSQQYAAGLVRVIGLWAVSGWRPGATLRGTGIGPMLVFGGHVTVANIVNYLAKCVDKVLIGKIYGDQVLGYYTKAFTLMSLPQKQIVNPISAVTLPALSRLVQDAVRYRRVFLSVYRYVCLISLPAAAFMVACPDLIVAILLGPQWSDSVSIFRYLGLIAITQPLATTVTWYFVSQGHTRTMMRWQMANSVLVVAAVAVGLIWGPKGVAAAYATSGVLVRMPLLFWTAGRLGPLRDRDFYRLAMPFGLATTFMFLVLMLLRQRMQFASDLVELALLTAAAAVLYLAALVVIPAGRQSILDIRRMLSILRPGGA